MTDLSYTTCLNILGVILSFGSPLVTAQGKCVLIITRLQQIECTYTSSTQYEYLIRLCHHDFQSPFLIIYH